MSAIDDDPQEFQEQEPQSAAPTKTKRNSSKSMKPAVHAVQATIPHQVKELMRNSLSSNPGGKASSSQAGNAGSDAQFDGQWDGSADALDQFVNGSDPAVQLEAMKVRLASTMDRYAFFNNARLGFSQLTAKQNRNLEFDIRCRSGNALKGRFKRGVPEVKRLLNGNKVHHMEKGTVHQRLKMIDQFVHKENVRVNSDSPPPVRTIPRIRSNLSTELPSYSDIITGKGQKGQKSADPVLATTFGVPPQKVPLSGCYSSPTLFHE